MSSISTSGSEEQDSHSNHNAEIHHCSGSPEKPGSSWDYLREERLWSDTGDPGRGTPQRLTANPEFLKLDKSISLPSFDSDLQAVCDGVESNTSSSSSETSLMARKPVFLGIPKEFYDAWDKRDRREEDGLREQKRFTTSPESEDRDQPAPSNPTGTAEHSDTDHPKPGESKIRGNISSPVFYSVAL